MALKATEPSSALATTVKREVQQSIYNPQKARVVIRYNDGRLWGIDGSHSTDPITGIRAEYLRTLEAVYVISRLHSWGALKVLGSA
jgi:hypothetical protein